LLVICCYYRDIILRQWADLGASIKNAVQNSKMSSEIPRADGKSDIFFASSSLLIFACNVEISERTADMDRRSGSYETTKRGFTAYPPELGGSELTMWHRTDADSSPIGKNSFSFSAGKEIEMEVFQHAGFGDHYDPML
jgi:hypothetical protein